jgi:hypothetical protein
MVTVKKKSENKSLNPPLFISGRNEQGRTDQERGVLNTPAFSGMNCTEIQRTYEVSHGDVTNGDKTYGEEVY